MQSQLPTYEINQIPFLVDVGHSMLRHPENQWITISFIHDMEDMGTHYAFFIDRKTNEAVAEYHIKNYKDVLKVNIPQMVMLDPIGVAEKYNLGVSQLPPRDEEIIPDPLIFREREMGKLPILDICGHPFYIDVRIDLLRPKDDFSTMGIRLSSLDMDESETKYLFLYHKKKHINVPFDPAITKFPKDIVAIEIPYENILDSYAVAREHNLLGSESWFRNFPVRKGLIARVLPWEETALPMIITENLEKQKKVVNKKKTGKRL